MVAISAMEQMRLETEKMIPIRKAVLGEWKMVEYQNWEDAKKYGWCIQDLCEDLKFELEDGKLIQSGAGFLGSRLLRIEGNHGGGVKMLYVEDDHLKSIWTGGPPLIRTGDYTDDIYIENGRLHYVVHYDGGVWKRIYEKNEISEMEKLRLENKELREKMSAPAPRRSVPEEKTTNLTKEGSQKNKKSSDFCDFFDALPVIVILTAYICVFVALIYTSVNNPVPIKEDIKGSWKLADHMNFEGYQKAHDNSNLNFEKFSENLRFDTLPDGRLVQTGGGSPQIIEDSTRKMILYEEDNHLKSYKTDYSTEDRFVEDGQLIRIDFFEGGVTKRVYERI